MHGVNQVQVNAKANLTFASTLRSILRQDPDIIMVGEIRDEDTAEIAVPRRDHRGIWSFPRCTPTTRPAPSSAWKI